MTYSTIILEKKGRVAKITLNRPTAMNAVNGELRRELGQAVDEVIGDQEADVLIITGAGKAFCAGLDLKELGQTTAVLSTYPSPWDKIRTMEKPTIAAVNGFAITGGFELALSCDIIVASDNAKFADTHARVGILPGGGMTQLLPRLVGIKKAKELSFTGNYLTAQEALQFGLVNRVVPPEDLLPTVEKLAADILSNDQTALRKIKRLIDKGEGMTLEDSIVFEKYEHFVHRQQQSAAEVERRRGGIMARGREQAEKKS